MAERSDSVSGRLTILAEGQQTEPVERPGPSELVRQRTMCASGVTTGSERQCSQLVCVLCGK